MRTTVGECEDCGSARTSSARGTLSAGAVVAEEDDADRRASGKGSSGGCVVAEAIRKCEKPLFGRAGNIARYATNYGTTLEYQRRKERREWRERLWEQEFPWRRRAAAERASERDEVRHAGLGLRLLLHLLDVAVFDLLHKLAASEEVGFQFTGELPRDHEELIVDHLGKGDGAARGH